MNSFGRTRATFRVVGPNIPEKYIFEQFPNTFLGTHFRKDYLHYLKLTTLQDVTTIALI